MVQNESEESGVGKTGIRAITACLFIVGEIAGAGVLAIPLALMSTGWYLGTFLMVVTCAGSAFCGWMLGQCWHLIEQSDEHLEGAKTRNPYSVIGYRAFGRWGSNVTAVSLIVTLFGGSIVQLLLSAEMIGSLLQPVVPHNPGFGSWVIVIGFILMPLTFFGSPVDFTPVAFFAMSSTSLAALLILISCLTTDAPVVEVPEYELSFLAVLTAIGTMCFAFSGASAMPTIQNDMKNKKSFTKAVILAFAILIAIYLPVAVVCYNKYGDGIKSNVIRNLPSSPLTTSIRVLMTGHVLCAFLILMNPVNLTIENFFGIDHSFNFFRCSSRVLVTLFSIFVGLSVPKFGKLLSLVGASAVVIQTYILPVLFYYRLKNQDSTVSRRMKVLLSVILVASLLTAVGATASAIYDLLEPSAFTSPCYVSYCQLDE